MLKSLICSCGMQCHLCRIWTFFTFMATVFCSVCFISFGLFVYSCSSHMGLGIKTPSLCSCKLLIDISGSSLILIHSSSLFSLWFWSLPSPLTLLEAEQCHWRDFYITFLGVLREESSVHLIYRTARNSSPMTHSILNCLKLSFTVKLAVV